ncbi:MAG: class IV adenylate cyclase [Thermoanaerobaculia bacterium]|nr:class IV adenylate cyclase [Thermoanaerobaculia bacterium]
MKEQRARDRQIKFASADHGQLRERLRELEAECQGSQILEDNWIFDRDGAIEATGSNLRLRVDRRGARLAFQGPASFDGPVKIRNEHETGVDEMEETRAILESLGYRVIRRYQKYREQWQLGSIAISLDHTPIGDFVEFEGEGCERVARRCGLDPEQAEGRSYLQLYESHLEAHPDAPADMVFT